MMMIEQIRAPLDLARKKKNKETKVQAAVLKPLEFECYRLSPADGVLEREVNMAVAVLWVPVIPVVVVKFASDAKTSTSSCVASLLTSTARTTAWASGSA